MQLNKWDEQSVLNLQDVCVQHDEHAPYSIQDVDLTVKGKKRIGIIGASGSGKSTLTDVLGGFVEPSSGQITLNGQPLVHLQMKEWQKEVVYMPQHPYLFHMTLRENIRFMNRMQQTKKWKELCMRLAYLSWLRSCQMDWMRSLENREES